MKQSAWMPTLAPSDSPLFERLVSALETDVAVGRLTAGTRLPTHRDLAHALRVGVGTVTRAYAEAERRGLIHARVGQGTFVASATQADVVESVVDLSNNLLPLPVIEPGFRALLGALARDPDAASLAAYPTHDGAERVRHAVARWLEQAHGFAGVDPRQLVITAGAVQGLAVVTQLLAQPGDTVLCEASTFYGFKGIAERLGIRLVGVAIDGEGLVPEALEIAAQRTGARVVQVIPTLHNPTTRSCSLARRQALVEVARRHDLTIIEDDVYGALARGTVAAVPLATLAPERTYYIGSASKCLAPGLRAGWVLPPEGAREEVVRAVRTLSVGAPGFGPLMFAMLVERDEAGRWLAAVRAEAEARTQLACSMLAGSIVAPSAPQSLHLWIPMPMPQAERVARLALERGVRVTPPRSPLVGAEAPTGIRLCVAAPRDRSRLADALERVRESIAASTHERDEAVM